METVTAPSPQAVASGDTAPSAERAGRYVQTCRVAKLLNMTSQTVREWSRRGLLPPPVVKTHRLWLWDMTEVEEYLARARERNATPRPTGGNGHAA